MPTLILQDSEFSFVYLQSFGTTPPSFLSAVDYSDSGAGPFLFLRDCERRL